MAVKEKDPKAVVPPEKFSQVEGFNDSKPSFVDGALISSKTVINI